MQLYAYTHRTQKEETTHTHTHIYTSTIGTLNRFLVVEFFCSGLALS